jgi:hypothetical protein
VNDVFLPDTVEEPGGLEAQKKGEGGSLRGVGSVYQRSDEFVDFMRWRGNLIKGEMY